MDYSNRERYRARRKAIERRRQVILIGSGIAALVMLGASIWIWRSDKAAAPAEADVVAAQTTTSLLRPTLTPVAEPITIATVDSQRDDTTIAGVAAPEDAVFFNDQRLMYEPGQFTPQIQAFLDQQPGPLKSMVLRVGDRQHTVAEVLLGQSFYSSLNPDVLLALLEQQSKLLSTPNPSQDQFDWAMNYRGENGNKRGLQVQIRWARGQITRAKRDYLDYLPLTYADGSQGDAPPNLSLSEYALARVLAATTTPDQLGTKLNDFLATYTRLFGDPRPAPANWPTPSQPFLHRPNEKTAMVTSFFDHDWPFLTQNGGTYSYWGRNEPDLSYDGHDGWDYALAPPDVALAAATGDVVFAGNADDNCNTRAVIIDHGNGYRTLYWHLSQVGVQIGQRVETGAAIGVIGESGCAFGPHLHFGVQFLGRNVDPYGWCSPTADPWAANPSGEPSTWLWADRPSPCEPAPEGAVVVDTDSPGFFKSGDGWQTADIGYGGSSLYVNSERGSDNGQPWEPAAQTEPNVVAYRPDLPHAGRYRVLAYVPYVLIGPNAQNVRYHVQSTGSSADIVVDHEVYANDWVDLGTYTFTPDVPALVTLSNLAEDNQLGVWADAVIWIPAES